MMARTNLAGVGGLAMRQLEFTHASTGTTFKPKNRTSVVTTVKPWKSINKYYPHLSHHCIQTMRKKPEKAVNTLGHHNRPSSLSIVEEVDNITCAICTMAVYRSLIVALLQSQEHYSLFLPHFLGLAVYNLRLLLIARIWNYCYSDCYSIIVLS